MSKRTSFAVDKTVTLGINGSTQRIRLCATRTGLPPLLIVQAGPGLPVLNEVAKLQQRLRLEQQFLVAYWEQRGCGAASREDAMSRKVRALEKPPYVDPAAIQRRARLLADLGTIERGKTFNALLREALFSMIRTYGVVGAVRALRNINIVQRTMLPELVPLDLFAAPPRLAVPVHCVFGEQDALLPATVVKDLPAAIIAPACTVRLLPDAGHMVHFDQPDIVRSIAVSA